MKIVQVGDFSCKIGESARENWDLVDQARKGHWFFHLTDFPSPYVVLECDRAEPNAHLKEQCAELCVAHSKQSKNKKVKVDATPCNNVRVDRQDEVGECDYKNEGKVEVLVVSGFAKSRGGNDPADAGESAGGHDHGDQEKVSRGKKGGQKGYAARKAEETQSAPEPIAGEFLTVSKTAGLGGWATVAFKDAAVRDAVLRQCSELNVKGGVAVKLQEQVDRETKEPVPGALFAYWGRKAEEKAPVAPAELMRCLEAVARPAAESVARAAPVRASAECASVRKAAVGGCAVLALTDAAARDFVLETTGGEAEVGGVVVKLRGQVDPKTKEPVANEIFASWGRKVEERTPVSEHSFLAWLQELLAGLPPASETAADAENEAA